jgi:hypothetical protein
MSNTVISVRSSGEGGNTPSLGVLANGELALNYADGILYYKTQSNTLGQIKTTQPAGLNQELQFNDSGSFGSSVNLSFNKTTSVLTVTGNVSLGNLVISGGIVANGTVGTSQQVLSADGLGGVYWSTAVGPQGPQGPQGETGPQGPQG